MRISLPSPLVAAALLLAAPSAHAVCNVIPGATGDFRGAVGVVNRPFASPGDLVGVEVRPELCEADSPDLAAQPEEHVVAVLYTPVVPGAPVHAVVLADDCDDPAVVQQTHDCGADFDSAQPQAHAQCDDGGSPLVAVRSEPTLARRELFFRFPDPEPLFGAPFTGPAKIVVAARGAALGCGPVAADRGCATAGGALTACIDELFVADGSCRTGAADVDPVFGHFTALPVPNDFAALCTGDGCTSTESVLRVTTDRAGNLLVPWDYRGVLVRDANDLPVARLGRADLALALPAGTLPEQGALASYSPEGVRVPPLFTPLAPRGGGTSLFGTIDAPRGVVRIARSVATCAGPVNAGAVCLRDADCGAQGGACLPGPTLLPDFSGAFTDGGAGVVELAEGADFTLATERPVPLSGLAETDALFAFVVDEALVGDPAVADDGDVNGDGDEADFVATLADGDTGEPVAIGDAVGAEGQAVTRFDAPPFSFPAVAVEGHVVALLQNEPRSGFLGTGGVDVNGDGDAFDSALRVFRLDPAGAQELTDRSDVLPPLGAPDSELGRLVASALPVIEGRPLAVSGGRVFYRTRELLGVRRRAHQVGLSDAGGQPSGDTTHGQLSRDGRFLVFESLAPDVVAGDTNGARDVFLRDRDPLGDGLDGPDAATERVSVGHLGQEGLGLGPPQEAPAGETPWVSDDGQSVAFASVSPNLLATFEVDPVSGFPRTAHDVFLRRRGTATTVAVSTDAAGNLGTPACRSNVPTAFPPPFDTLTLGFGSLNPVMTPDARYVAFHSFSPDLVPGDTNLSPCPAAGPPTAGLDVFVKDTQTGAIARVSVRSDGAQGTGGHAFTSALTPSVASRTPCSATMPVGCTLGLRQPTISDDGRFVAFDANMSLVQGFAVAAACADPNVAGPVPCFHVYLHDRDANCDTPAGCDGFDGPDITTRLVSIPLPGQQEDGHSFVTGISADGRTVAFESESSRIVPGDTNGQFDVFVFDRLAPPGEEITLLSQNAGGALAEGGFSGLAALSPRGDGAAFLSLATNLPGDDLDPLGDAFVTPTDEIDPARLGTPLAFLSVSQLGINRNLRHAAVSTVDPVLDPSGTPVDGTGVEDLYVVELDDADPNTLARDLDGDGDFGDALLRALDTGTSPAALLELGPGTDVALADGSAAFLRDERNAGSDPGDPAQPGAGTCSVEPNAPAADDDLNGDGDCADRVAMLFRGVDAGGAPIVDDLGLAASAVDRTPSLVVALVSEAGEGASLNGQELPQAPAPGAATGDADMTDHVVHVLETTALPPGVAIPTSQPDGAFALWTNLGFQADAAEGRDLVVPDGAGGTLDRPVVVFLTDEAAHRDLDGDGQPAARVLQVYDVHAERLVPIVAGDGAGGFAPAAPQPALDFVVGDSFVAFRTPEAELPAASCDIGGPAGCGDAVLQAYRLEADAGGDLRAVLVSSGATAVPCALEACDPRQPYRPKRDTIRFLLDEVVEQADRNDDLDQQDLLVAVFTPAAPAARAVRTLGEVERVAPTPSDESAPPPANGVDPLADPPFDGPGDNSQVFLTGGLCVEDTGSACSSDAQCAAGEQCLDDPAAPGAFACRRVGATCRIDAATGLGVGADCAPAERCLARVTVASGSDRDGDEVLDALDNCPDAANPEQRDGDLDGVGDACDAQECGNSADPDPLLDLEPGEECDDGRHCQDGTPCTLDAECAAVPGDGLCRPRDGDGCTRFCQVGGCFGDVDLNGRVDAQDAAKFDAVAGCYPCANGCNPVCDAAPQDGVVNNLDSLALQSALGADCPAPVGGSGAAAPASGTRCGAGAELLGLLAPAALLRARRRRHTR